MHEQNGEGKPLEIFRKNKMAKNNLGPITIKKFHWRELTLDDLHFQGNAKQDLYLLVWRNTKLLKVSKEIN